MVFPGQASPLLKKYCKDGVESMCREAQAPHKVEAAGGLRWGGVDVRGDDAAIVVLK